MKEIPLLIAVLIFICLTLATEKNKELFSQLNLRRIPDTSSLSLFLSHTHPPKHTHTLHMSIFNQYSSSAASTPCIIYNRLFYVQRKRKLYNKKHRVDQRHSVYADSDLQSLSNLIFHQLLLPKSSIFIRQPAKC